MQVWDVQVQVVLSYLRDEDLLDGSVLGVAAADGGRLLQGEAHRLGGVALSTEPEDVRYLLSHSSLFDVDGGLVRRPEGLTFRCWHVLSAQDVEAKVLVGKLLILASSLQKYSL